MGHRTWNLGCEKGALPMPCKHQVCEGWNEAGWWRGGRKGKRKGEGRERRSDGGKGKRKGGGRAPLQPQAP
eukprot:350665-Chlamydomonas_euryale.AAC.1